MSRYRMPLASIKGVKFAKCRLDDILSFDSYIVFDGFTDVAETPISAKRTHFEV